MPAELNHESGIVGRVSHAAALVGGCVILAAGGVIVISVISRRLLSTSIPGDVELIQAATAIAAFAFLPLGQIHRSTIVVDTFTSRLPARARKESSRPVSKDVASLSPRARRSAGLTRRYVVPV